MSKNALDQPQDKHDVEFLLRRHSHVTLVEKTSSGELIVGKATFHDVAVPGMNAATTCIRRAAPSDAPAIADIYAHYVRNTLVTFELDPPNAAEMSQRMARSVVWLVCVTAGDREVVGYAYACPYKPERPAYDVTVEISVYLRHDGGWIRRGIGRELVTALHTALRAIRVCGAAQRYRQALAIQAMPATDDTAGDPPAGGFYQALGFVHSGTLRRVGYKLGIWADVHFWQMDLEA